MDTRQLVLIDNDESASELWRLDEHTRKVGLDGIAEARRALQAASARNGDQDLTAA